MKTCKDLNIELCDPCLGQYNGPCFIEDWLNWFNKTSVSEIIDVYSLRVKNHPNDNLYCFKALEIYDPKLFENINKLMILL